jgi:dipeptidyl aminopeptidase/acylaminoacyl peptidase/cbb3-type cytochrome oxidase subunit 3
MENFMKRYTLKFIFFLTLAFFLLAGMVFVFAKRPRLNFDNSSGVKTALNGDTVDLPAFAIEMLRKREYLGSDIVIEQTLSNGTNYHRFIASYKSDGLKIYGLLTVPDKEVEAGWPAIIFIHGHLPPKEYKTTERYVLYQDGFAKNGFVTFKPDLRGHGNSEGQPANSNFSADYVIDALNATASIQKLRGVNLQKIGMWGHSMGGGIILRSMVISEDIKVGVIWAGVVGDYEDLLERYRKRVPWINVAASSSSTTTSDFFVRYGSPSANPRFWGLIDPYAYLSSISGPIQLHHGTLDSSVPIEFSKHLYEKLKGLDKKVEYYEYPGSDHNIAQEFSSAMARSIEFFNRFLKTDEI